MTLSAALVLLVGCSNDEVEESRRQSAPIELAAYVSTYTDVEPIGPASTRAAADWMPSGYMPYSDLGVLLSNENDDIGVFFTNDGSGSPVLLPRKFRYRDEKWVIDKEIENGDDYYLYGYVPYSAAKPFNNGSLTATTIEPNSKYADGAILTLRGLNSVMTQDLCVIVGAKHGKKENESVVPDTDGKMVVGDFMCNIRPGSDANPNYVFLLFDHLCSALRFRFHVDAKYAELRTIKLKRLDLSAYSNEACTTPAKKCNATITLQKTLDGTSPIVSVGFTQSGDGDSNNSYKEKIYEYTGNGNGEELPSDDEQYTDHLGFALVINDINYYMLHSIYDVYDRKGNLIRENCEAKNKINIGMVRGKIYTLKLTVMPTYLYVLSEPDLDNPTITIE